MAREEVTRIVLEGDSDGAVRATEQAGDAADDAAGDFDRLGGSVDEVTDDLERLDRTDVDIDVDTTGLDRAQKSTKGVSETAQRGIGPLRGLTDEFGGAAGEAGIMGAAIVDAGEAVEIFGAKAGFSQKAIGRLSTVLSVAAVGVAAATFAWKAYREEQERAEERMRSLVEVQRLLSDGSAAEAAAKLNEEFEGIFETLEDRGASGSDVIKFLQGDIEELGVSLTDMEGKVLVGWRESFNAAAQDVIDTDERVDELTVALGGTLEATEEVGEGFGDATGFAEAFGVGAANAMAVVETAIQDVMSAVDALQLNISNEQSFRRIRDAGRSAMAAIGEAFDMAGDSADEHAADIEGAEDALLDLRGEVAKYATDILNLPDEKVTEIDARLRAGAIDEVIAELEAATRVREAVINVIVRNSAAPPSSFAGGPTIPSSAQSVQVNVQQVAEPRDVANSINTWNRLNGSSIGRTGVG